LIRIDSGRREIGYSLSRARCAPEAATTTRGAVPLPYNRFRHGVDDPLPSGFSLIFSGWK
jgi:hypothetical protein